jgi:hypothetical protein
LPESAKGQELLVGKIEREAPEVRAVLDGSVNPFGEGSLRRQARDGAAFDFGLVFSHHQAQGRKIKDLAAFVVQHGLAAQGHAAALAAGTAMQWMHLGVVGLFDRLQGVARMARLAAGLAPGFRSQIFGSRFGPAIAGGGFAAIAAVESLTILQLTDCSPTGL